MLYRFQMNLWYNWYNKTVNLIYFSPNPNQISILTYAFTFAILIECTDACTDVPVKYFSKFLNKRSRLSHHRIQSYLFSNIILNQNSGGLTISVKSGMI